MEKQHKVSLWLGKLENKNVFEQKIKERYNDDGDMISDFMEDFKIDYIDSQFTENHYYGNESSPEKILDGFSYIESFVSKLPLINWNDFNAIILAYNFEYRGDIQSKDNVKFIGSFEFIED